MTCQGTRDDGPGRGPGREAGLVPSHRVGGPASSSRGAVCWACLLMSSGPACRRGWPAGGLCRSLLPPQQLVDLFSPGLISLYGQVGSKAPSGPVVPSFLSSPKLSFKLESPLSFSFLFCKIDKISTYFLMVVVRLSKVL